MLTLVPAAVLVLLGFGFVVLGFVTDNIAVGVIGGVVIVGVGAAIVGQGGLSHQAGEREVIVEETGNRTVVETEPYYEPVETPVNLPLGYLTMLGGALLSFGPLINQTGGS